LYGKVPVSKHHTKKTWGSMVALTSMGKRAPQYPLDKRLSRPYSHLDVMVKRKIHVPVVHLIASHFTY